MSKSERLFEVMQILRRLRRPVTSDELAIEMEVSKRTVYRYIGELQGMGANIEGEAGIGYLLRPGFLMPPLMLLEEEVIAFVIGAQWVAKQTDEALAEAARNGIAKLAAVLPLELISIVDDNSFHVGGKVETFPAFDLAAIRHAMRNQKKIRLAYRDGNSTETERIVWPIAVGFVGGSQYVATWCELRNDFRTFRADRVSALTVLDDRYPGRRAQLVKKWRQNAEERKLSASQLLP